jgi:hypothetical protein
VGFGREKIGNGEETNVIVDYCYKDGPEHEKPIHEWHIELAVERLGCVDDFDLWEVRELHYLGEEL